MSIFLVFEQNDSGALPFPQFEEAVREMVRDIGLEPSSTQVKRLFRQVDKDGNGRVDFEEFLKLFSQLYQSKKQRSASTAYHDEQKIEKLLKLFDTDGDGLLCVDEFQNVVDRLGMRLGSEETKLLFKNLDGNEDGRINLNELINYLAK